MTDTPAPPSLPPDRLDGPLRFRPGDTIRIMGYPFKVRKIVKHGDIVIRAEPTKDKTPRPVLKKGIVLDVMGLRLVCRKQTAHDSFLRIMPLGEQ